ncbi:MAG: hypothetical protein HRU24_19120 [Gammaproteobacteria bacterium]|nr:hypothetical protein [Gammaproteobacteria bacterium]
MPLADILNSSVDELINGQEKTRTDGKRGLVSKLQQHIEQIGLIPRDKQKFITEMLEALIKQQQSA